MWPSRRSGGAEGLLLLLCMSMVHGHSETSPPIPTPATASVSMTTPTPPTASVSMTIPAPPTASVSMTPPPTASVSMTPPPTASVSMTPPPTASVSMTPPPTASVSMTPPPKASVSMTPPPTASVSMTTPSTASASMTPPSTAATPSVSMETTPTSTSVSQETLTTSKASTPAVSMTTTPASTTSVSTDTTAVSTTNAPTPILPDAVNFKAVQQTESSITLQWSWPGERIYNYSLKFVETSDSSNCSLKFVETSDSSNCSLKFVETSDSSNCSLKSEETSDSSNCSLVVVETRYSSNCSLVVEETSDSANGTNSTCAGTMNFTVQNLKPARRYKFTLYTMEHNTTSSGVCTVALTAPVNIVNVSKVDQNSSSIRLQWCAVENVTTYWVEYSAGGNAPTGEEVAAAGQMSVNYTASGLRSATSYTFTIYSRLENISSSGFNISTFTAPLAVTMVTVNRWLREVELKWSRDGNSRYHLLFGIQSFSLAPAESGSGWVTQKISSLVEGTRYNYSITASYLQANSSTYQNYTVTPIDCSGVSWWVTNSSIHASIHGVFTHVSATNGSDQPQAPEPDPPGNVSLSGLYPGASYSLGVYYETLLLCQHNLTLPPPDIRAQCAPEASDAILLHWAPPGGKWTGVEVNVTGKPQKLDHTDVEMHQTVLRGFGPARTYQVSTCLLSGRLRSTVQVLDCHTDPTGVIAGSVLSVLVCLLLVALGVYVWRRRRSQPRRHRSNYVGWLKPTDTYQSIPVEMFEDHVSQMSRDENRGFSEEYESFIPVGTEQTRKVAMVPENKPKNRFTNVLPYDWSRVTLCPLMEVENSDYINASFLPGYSDSREYIAAQGPLAGTLVDFWRMVWEQGVTAIAMVTNCTEGGRAKCEQYWPLDYTPCLYGDLLVTSTAEQTQPSWTLRSFTVKNRATYQQRAVQHFHFQAWPDHGVPDDTASLLQFRALLRQHIEQEGGGSTPTLVHCSAGVGRTGTLVALDVLLQQMETEGRVGVASFIHKMRLSRPLMVQTESQYVFLHRCLLEAMRGGAALEEHTYQNWDTIYTNASALQGLQDRPSGITSV